MGQGSTGADRRASFCGVALVVLATACARGAGREAFASERIYEPIGKPIRYGATTRERFRLDRSSFAAPRGPESSGWTWTTPPGWSELPTTSLRVANFRVAGEVRAECYLTTLSGEGGGLEANVNRWRAQMQAPPLSPAEVAALPRMDWLGGSAVFVEIDGTWSGMSGDQVGSDYRLVGLLRVDPMESQFLKMIGPRALTAAETDHFIALARCLRPSGQPAPAMVSPPSGALPRDAAHSGLRDDETGLASGGATSSSALGWTAPTGWTQGPDRAMREVTFFAGEKREVECYVTALAGNGGGLAANLNRWRGQMGRPDLTEAEISLLPTIPMLGTEARLVEIAREGGESDVVIGVVCVLSDHSVFVKMIGRKIAVEGQRAAFVEFCKSIRNRG